MALMAKVPALQSSVNDSLSSSGITLADVESALGPTTDVVELGTSATPTEVFFTNPKDPATLKSLLAKDKSQKSVTDEINGWVMVAKSQAALAELRERRPDRAREPADRWPGEADAAFHRATPRAKKSARLA